MVSALEGQKAIADAVDRLIQHTGRKSGTGAATTIGLVTEFNADTASACTDHWRGIATLCHEVLHGVGVSHHWSDFGCAGPNWGQTTPSEAEIAAAGR